MTRLEAAIRVFIDIFYDYAKSEGKTDTLTKEQFRTLMEIELPGMLQDGKEKDNFDKILKDLDGEVDFKEFFILVGRFQKGANK